MVALSGGVDSAATVLVLKERGYEVTAVTFLLDGEASPQTEEVARRLGVPLIVEDIREEFRRVIVEPFIDGYLRGETPAPCTRCNPLIKWNTLARVADRAGIRFLSTGHYVRIGQEDGIFFVRRGVDPSKDQSYYLWNLDQSVLSRAVTPMGDFTKKEAKGLMNLFGFGDLAEKRESMGVCFLRGVGYADWLKLRRPELARLAGGTVKDASGRTVGTHAGYPFYTPGQRKNIDFLDGRQGYVIEVVPQANELIVGRREELVVRSLVLTEYRIADRREFFSTDRLKIKIRGIGLNPEGYCSVREEGGELRVDIPSGAYAPAKGQPIVFYIGDRVAGGGYVK